MEFKICKDYEDKIYYKIEKLQNGQMAGISFLQEKNKKNNLFFVSFAVSNKRKELKNFIIGEKSDKNISCLNTGKIGIKSLLWAKNMIKEFENSLINRDIHTEKKKRIFIIIGADDSRRFRAYERGLRDLSYKVDFSLGVKHLKKEVIL